MNTIIRQTLKKPVIHLDDYLTYVITDENVKRLDLRKVAEMYERRRKALLEGIELLTDELKRGVLYWREFADESRLKIDNFDNALEMAKEEYNFVEAMKMDPLAMEKEDVEKFEGLIKQFFLGNLMLQAVKSLAGEKNSLKEAIEIAESYDAFSMASDSELAKMAMILKRVKQKEARELIKRLNSRITNGKIIREKAARALVERAAKGETVESIIWLRLSKEINEEKEIVEKSIKKSMVAVERKILQIVKTLDSWWRKLKLKIAGKVEKLHDETLNLSIGLITKKKALERLSLAY